MGLTTRESSTPSASATFAPQLRRAARPYKARRAARLAATAGLDTQVEHQFIPRPTDAEIALRTQSRQVRLLHGVPVILTDGSSAGPPKAGRCGSTPHEGSNMMRKQTDRQSGSQPVVASSSLARIAKPKRFDISKAVLSGYSLNAIRLEMQKCDIRCANCHRRRTAKQFGWYRLLTSSKSD